MWANRDWVGSYLPSDTVAGRELNAYSRVCNSVEGNTTFYALPSSDVVRRWHESTPDGFRFMLKLPRTITHQRRLRDAASELGEFVERFEPLLDRLGPCSVQLPASFGPDDLEVLTAFLDRLPGEFEWAVEVRHLGFHAGGSHERFLNDALNARGVDRVIFDSRALFDGPCETPEEEEAFEQKPRVPVRAVATGSQPVVRFVGQTAGASNAAYWLPWVDRVVRWIEAGRRPLMFFHTPDNAVAPSLCRQFHAEVCAALPALVPLAPAPLPAVQPGLDFTA